MAFDLLMTYGILNSAPFVAPPGQVEFTTQGTYSWTPPEGVESVSVVAIGGGAGRRTGGSGVEHGGGGGGLGWKNNIPVVPGQNYTIVVASGGADNQNGGTSYFINTSTVAGFGGDYFNRTAAGYTGDGGGNGGLWAYGFYYSGSNNYGPGGSGGAGGYSGNGGNGGGSAFDSGASGGAGQGGGGGGGAGDANGGVSTAGGGVGIYGEGANGPGGSNASKYSPGSGFAGSGGTSQDPSTTPRETKYGGGWGGSGAVRIIWTGDGSVGTRSFPSTNTQNV
jgi:hypothetical protein